MVAQIRNLHHYFSGNGTENREMKGPLIVYGFIASNTSGSVGYYINSRYDDTPAQIDFILDNTRPIIMFSEPVIFEKGLLITFYNNTGGATSLRLSVLFKNISRMK